VGRYRFSNGLAAYVSNFSEMTKPGRAAIDIVSLKLLRGRIAMRGAINGVESAHILRLYHRATGLTGRCRNRAFRGCHKREERKCSKRAGDYDRSVPRRRDDNVAYGLSHPKRLP
jgi:hypothetical protein